MLSQKLQGVKLPASADFHDQQLTVRTVHLRDGAMMGLVVRTIRRGAVNVVYVMPNLVPPVTTVQHALEYRSRLEALEPRVKYLMSLFLHESITAETIIEAKKRGITGVKSYPAGVTTNSSSGVVDYARFYPVFEEMQRQDLVLNLHGECPSNGDITVVSAEEHFLPTLFELHERFPRLRIVLEHLSTAAAVEAVKKCGPTVAGTITAHHLFLTLDDFLAGDPFCFCKPVAKERRDRDALLRAAASGNSKFFFGSDSAPHPASAKRGADKIPAGIFSQPYTTQNVLDAFEHACEDGVLKLEDITQDILEGFLGGFGRAFYGVEEAEAEAEAEGEEEGEEKKKKKKKEFIELRKADERIVDAIRTDDGGVEVVPFRRGQKTWSVTWV